MKIISDNIIDVNKLKSMLKRPALFEKSVDKFWDDEHISEQMLKSSGP